MLFGNLLNNSLRLNFWFLFWLLNNLRFFDWLCLLNRLWGRGNLRLANLREVNLAQCLQPDTLLQHLLGLGNRFFGLLSLLDLLFLDFLGKHHISLSLHGLVGAKLINQGLILFIRNLGIGGSIVADLTQTALLLQKVNSRLKSYIQF